MGKINSRRVILGGLLAGVVVNVFEWVVAALLLGEEYAAALAALGKTAEVTAGLAVFGLAYGFGYGIIAIWFYGAVRPRFGPGPRTAAYVALALWLIGYLAPNLVYIMLDLFPVALMTKASVLGLVEILLGTELGAWLYKE